ncbi:MAG: glycosyltransferase [Gammaproteobacteria bacterium]
MKVLHVITGLQTGGAERMLANLCILAQRQGDSPVVVSMMAGGSQFDRLRDAGVTVRSLGMSRGRPSIAGLWRLARIIRDEVPDVIQSWMYHADLYALAARRLSRRRRHTPLFWGVRCSDMDVARYGPSLRLVVRLNALLSRYPDGIVANSDAGVRAHRRIGFETARMTVIDNGFDTDRFQPDADARRDVRQALSLPEEAFVVGVVARVDAMKDFPTLAAALERLDGVTCLAAGNGTEALPPAKGLVPLGERGDIPAVLNACDLLVSVSAFGEGFSNVIGEAMATGIPVVATDVGDARRIVGIGGRIVPPGDPAALAEAIALLRDDPQTRRAMGKAGRQRIERDFSLRRSADAFAALYRQAVSAPENDVPAAAAVRPNAG